MGTHALPFHHRSMAHHRRWGKLRRAAGAYAALQHPEVWGNVVAQIGAFYWRQGQDRAPDNGQDTNWNGLIRRYVTAPTLPVCFHLDVGIYETDLEPWGANTNTLSTSRHMRDVLQAKG